MAFSLCFIPARAEGTRAVIPMGNAVGVKLFANGVLVISVCQEDCRLKAGDLLLSINNEKITSTEFLQSYLQRNADAPVALCLQRENRKLSYTLQPYQDAQGIYRIGAWVRDSMAGIGTMTYYDPATGEYGALGHGITDVDTALLMSLSSGAIMKTSVKAVKRGSAGDPGELRGDFTEQKDIGSLRANTCGGIFGIMGDEAALPKTEDALPVASADQVETGPATILATVSGETPVAYEVQILRVNPSAADMRNLLLEVTDPVLLERTGGIVQGMSGSPILQNGRIVGAVTHVLVDDPTRGYGIFLENMMRMAQ